MTGVAFLAEKFGYSVDGCDIEGSTAYSGRLSVGHDKKHVIPADFVVITPALLFQGGKNEEIEAAKKAQKLMTWQYFTGEFLAKDKKVICVAGTHGKSTTTAMLGKVLSDAGFDPIVLVGAKVPEWNGNAKYGKGEHFVIEADEFNDNFLNYTPEVVIINNIEFDHPDYFKNEDAVLTSFKKFVGKLSGMKVLIANKDSEGVQKLLKMIDTDTLKIIEYHGKSDKLGFGLGIAGKQNIENALGVYALGKFLGIKSEIIGKSLSAFKGIGRRMELIAERNGILFYDDYAHHPTAIAATLQAIREKHPKARIWAIDEPHGFARTKALLGDYKNSFKDADKVLVGPIFKARDHETFGITPGLVAKAAEHNNAFGLENFEEIKKILKEKLEKGDVVVVMGAGKSYLWAREIADLFPVSFADLTTFHIGGKIKKYFEVQSDNDIYGAVGYSRKNKLPIFIIGGGSDILVSDKDFDGVVVKYTGKEISYLGEGKIRAESGGSWDDLVEYAVQKNLQGIECLSGIPGTVGASPIQNIGAYGQELSNTFIKLRAFDTLKNKFVEFSKKDCRFGYRESIFKEPEYWQRFLITEITLKLTENGHPEVVYESLKKYFEDKGVKGPNLRQVREAVTLIRKRIFYDPEIIGNAGSFFKSPVVDKNKLESLRKKFPEIKFYAFGSKFKLPAGWLIEKTGWKGKSHKEAAVSPNHALILINKHNKAKATEIIELSEKIIKDVKKMFGLTLEREVQLINF